MKRLLLISSSIVHGHGYLDHSESAIRDLLGDRKSIAFVPFAQHDHEGYTQRVRERFADMNIDVTQVQGPRDVASAEAVFVGGGNTFRLLNELYKRDLMNILRDRVNNGMPYIGSSAGTNVATPSIKTTNDMPIVYPPTFDALGFVSFQINPHYLDPDPNSTHKGETREERIREFHEENAVMVVGLREGGMLWVEDDAVKLIGDRAARIFRQGQEPEEVDTGAIIPL